MARKTRSTSKKQDDKTKTEAAKDAPETEATATPATPATAETASPATGDAAQPMLVINGQYIKGLSFEVRMPRLSSPRPARLRKFRSISM